MGQAFWKDCWKSDVELNLEKLRREMIAGDAEVRREMIAGDAEVRRYVDNGDAVLLEAVHAHANNGDAEVCQHAENDVAVLEAACAHADNNDIDVRRFDAVIAIVKQREDDIRAWKTFRAVCLFV